jgi:hypothetical protein
MITSTPYANLVAETRQQAIKAVESGFDFAARVLELQKQYTLGVAGLVAAVAPPADD